MRIVHRSRIERRRPKRLKVALRIAILLPGIVRTISKEFHLNVILKVKEEPLYVTLNCLDKVSSQEISFHDV